MLRRASHLGSLTLIALLLCPRPGAEGAGESTPLQRAWALAATALLTEQNGDRHDTLAGVELTPGAIEMKKRLLEEWWGVTDRGSLLDSLKRLEDGGHRAEFARVGARLAALTTAQRLALEVQRRRDFPLNQKLAVVELHYERLGATGIIGWDLTRFLFLCRWGYAVGYLTEPDAWDRMIPVARRLRYAFASWRELGENYMIGRQFWDPEEHVVSGHAFRRAFDRLRSDPDSPWNRVPWTVDFGAPPGTAK